MLCWVLWSSIQSLIAIDSPGISSSFLASFSLTAGFSSYNLQRSFFITMKMHLSDLDDYIIKFLFTFFFLLFIRDVIQ